MSNTKEKAIDFNDLRQRMDASIGVFRTDLSGLRTGRASATLLDAVNVSAYGGTVPLTQCASVSVPEARVILVNVWDSGLIRAVEDAIRASSMGFNPVVDGQMVRIPLPELSEERRRDLVKLAHKYAENARVAIRHIRRDGIDHIRKAQQGGSISKDEEHRLCAKVQKITDEQIEVIDTLLDTKEVDIMNI